MSNEKNYHGLTCEECGLKNFVNNKGFEVCRNCGTVRDKLYEESSFQYYSTNENSGAQFVSVGKKISQVGSLGSEIGYFKNYSFLSIQQSVKRSGYFQSDISHYKCYRILKTSPIKRSLGAST